MKTSRPFRSRALHLASVVAAAGLTACAGQPGKAPPPPPAPLALEDISAPEPDWVSEESFAYPHERYLSAVGSGGTREEAEDAAYSAIARIFQAQVDAAIDVRERARKTEQGGKVRLSTDTEIDRSTTVVTNKTLSNVHIAEVWVDRRHRVTYALAVLDRAQAAAALRNKITAIDGDIDALLQQVSASADKIEAVRNYRRVQRLALEREIYNTDLGTVNGTGQGVSPSVSVTQISNDIERLLRKDMRFGVEIKGPHGREIRAALREALTQAGFAVSAGGRMADKDVLLRGKVEFKNADLPRWKFVHWAVNLDLINGHTGKIFGAISRHGREGHLNFAEAETKAVQKLQKEIISNLGHTIVSYIYGD
ncbi:MAG TPA: hypothetical protein ENJ19_01120 [Gammaproteobacteria bacterium]|nr:hypothetical protein [Gammaproteobacteria bacterium]